MRTPRGNWRSVLGACGVPGFCLWVSAALVVPSPVSSAHQNPGWQACSECDDTVYTLSTVVFPAAAGTITLSGASPQPKGQGLIAMVNPSADMRFVEWHCDPPSHTASGATDEAVTVFMTANTTLTAILAEKYHEVTAYWDTTRGSVSMAGGQAGTGVVSAEAAYGDIVQLNASPNAGYFTYWQGQTSASHWAGRQYGDSISVRVRGDEKLVAHFEPVQNYPQSMNSVQLTVQGGSAILYSAGAPTSSFNAGPYPYAGSSGPGLFAFSAEPGIEFLWDHFHWTANGQTRYTRHQAVTYWAPNSYTANVVPKIRLNIEIDGSGVVSSDDFSAHYHPRPYTGAVTPPAGQTLTPLPAGNAVTMSPSPCVGWQFSHWEYKNANGDWVVYNPPLGNNMTVYMNWWPGAGIRVPEGNTTFDVKAVFEKRPVEFTITYKNFIAPNYIGSYLMSCLYGCCTPRWLYAAGDDRSFSFSSSKFRMRTTVDAAPSECDAENPMLGFSHAVGTTHHFASNAIGTDNRITQQAWNDSSLNDCDLKDCQATASSAGMAVEAERIDANTVVYHINGNAGNPCVSFSCGITYSIYVQLRDNKPAGRIEWAVLGSSPQSSWHDSFPWHELYLSVGPQYQTMHAYSPSGGILDLCHYNPGTFVYPGASGNFSY